MFETVIGLEVHVQLNTKTKLFCACPTSFAEHQNVNTCPTCLGLTGSPSCSEQRSSCQSDATRVCDQCQCEPLIKF